MGLLSQVREHLLATGKRSRTVGSYSTWLRKFYAWRKAPAGEWQPEDLRRFLYAMTDEGYSAISRKQAFFAVRYAFINVLHAEEEAFEDFPLPGVRRSQRDCPSVREIAAIFSHMHGRPLLQAKMMYASGLRISEVCRVRVKDLDFDNRQLIVRDAKGGKDRITILPSDLDDDLLAHLALRKAEHRCDLAAARGRAPLPGKLDAKYPGYGLKFGWQWVFQSEKVHGDTRWHTTPRHLQEQFAKAVDAAGIYKRLVPHSLRHGFATHLQMAGVPPREIQKLLGHTHLETTELYTHAMLAPRDIPSPLGLLGTVGNAVSPTPPVRPYHLAHV